MHEMRRVFSQGLSSYLKGRLMLYPDPQLHRNKTCVTTRCIQHILHTASRKRKPKLHRTWCQRNDAITPQFGDPRGPPPPPFNHVRPLSVCLGLPLPLTCMTPSPSRDQLPVHTIAFLRAPGPRICTQYGRRQPHMLPKATQGSSHPLSQQGTMR